MAKISDLLKSLGYITSVAKVNKLVDEIKRRGIKITDELNARISGKIIGREAIACWMRRKNNELETVSTIYKNRDYQSPTPVLNDLKVTTTSRKKRKRRRKGDVNTGLQLNPNSSSYESDMLKASLKNKYEGYDYDLSDW